MSGRIVCFGEVLLRLAAPDRGHLFQTARLDAHFGGAEANVAVALARIGVAASVVTTLPHGPVGDAALETIRAAGVDTAGVRRADGRLGLYYLSPPSGPRGAHIVYDRLDSVFATASPDAYDWDRLLDGAGWLHLSGIIPAIGPAAAALSLGAIGAARAAGVRVSFDGNFRASMWARWCPDPAPVLIDHVAQADLLIGNHRDIALLLNEHHGGDTPDARRRAAAAALARFPTLRTVASTDRRMVDADTHDLSARIDRRDGAFETEAVRVGGILDRIGTGDAFAAGILARIDDGPETAARTGLALAALKHATLGDHSRSTAADILSFSGTLADVRR